MREHLYELCRTDARTQSQYTAPWAYFTRTAAGYSIQELLKLLVGLRRFVDYVLEHRRCIRRPLETCVKRSIGLLVELPTLCCGNADTDHRKQLFELISKKFAKPMLSNYALGATDGNTAVRFFENKPLSRKVLKL